MLMPSSETAVLAETERFAFFMKKEDGVLSARLYKGIAGHKNLVAVCEETEKDKALSFAYLTESAEVVSYGEKTLTALLSTPYDVTQKFMMYHTENIRMASSKEPLPIVSEVGIRACLAAWRSGTVYRADQKKSILFSVRKMRNLYSIFKRKSIMLMLVHHKIKSLISDFLRACNISVSAIMMIIRFRFVFRMQALPKSEKM
jgi:intracellular sulfur oxidation DsrE/DsrF family protein